MTPESQALENWQAEQRRGEDIPDDIYRETSKRMLAILNRALSTIIQSVNPTLSAWQIAYALGADVCEGMSMTERSREIGVKRATISKGAIAFLDATSLPPSEYMKEATAAGSYAESRTSQLS